MLGCLCDLGSGECSHVAGTVDFVGEWCNLSQHDWLLDIAAIGEGD
jgi:hypothetical protein